MITHVSVGIEGVFPKLNFLKITYDNNNNMIHIFVLADIDESNDTCITVNTSHRSGIPVNESVIGSNL